MSGLVRQHFLNMIPTVDETITISATDTEATQTFRRPGRWLLQNLGTNTVYLRMLPVSSSFTITSSNGMPLFPVGTGELSAIEVDISPERENFSSGHNELHVVCATGETATVKATLVTKAHM